MHIEEGMESVLNEEGRLLLNQVFNPALRDRRSAFLLSRVSCKGPFLSWPWRVAFPTWALHRCCKSFLAG